MWWKKELAYWDDDVVYGRTFLVSDFVSHIIIRVAFLVVRVITSLWIVCGNEKKNRICSYYWCIHEVVNLGRRNRGDGGNDSNPLQPEGGRGEIMPSTLPFAPTTYSQYYKTEFFNKTNLFISFCTIFWYVVLGWYDNNLWWKYFLLF